jgi:hypothetical protein
LLKARALGEQPVRKILLDSLDSGELEQHFAGDTVNYPDNWNLALAFSTFRKWINERELKDLGAFLYRLKNQSIVIRLEVSDAKDAFKLFETINNRGLKLSPTDIESRSGWYGYSHARDMMLAATDTKVAPWHIVKSDDKKRARLNCIAHFLGQIPYRRVKQPKIALVGRSRKGAYDDEAPMKKRRWIPEAY